MPELTCKTCPFDPVACPIAEVLLAKNTPPDVNVDNPVPPSLVFNGAARLSIVALYNVTSLIPVANVLP